MQRCFDLALLGLGNTAPNPLVGSVIVYNNKIIGEGYHKKYGEPHAEVNAINSVEDKSLLKQSTLYANLEPCSHFGKTPPCTDLIIKNKIPRVVISNIDPSSEVSGKGVDKLKKANCEVIVGVLEKNGTDLNKRFFTFHKHKRPYVILKWAQTQDGFIDIIRKEYASQQPTWITNEIARTLVHKWRAEEQAILIGTNTAMIDNPRLTVRDWTGQNPLRIVIDQSLRLSEQLNIFNQEAPTFLFTSEANVKKANELYNKEIAEIIGMDFDSNMLQQILKMLHKKNLQSLIVEGGEKLLNNFINKNLWDEARVFTGNIKFFKGISAPKINLKKIHAEYLKNSKCDFYNNFYK